MCTTLLRYGRRHSLSERLFGVVECQFWEHDHCSQKTDLAKQTRIRFQRKLLGNPGPGILSSLDVAVVLVHPPQDAFAQRPPKSNNLTATGKSKKKLCSVHPSRRETLTFGGRQGVQGTCQGNRAWQPCRSNHTTNKTVVFYCMSSRPRYHSGPKSKFWRFLPMSRWTLVFIWNANHGPKVKFKLTLGFWCVTLPGWRQGKERTHPPVRKCR